jgi:uroporphyrinogen decarboxylase
MGGGPDRGAAPGPVAGGPGGNGVSVIGELLVWWMASGRVVRIGLDRTILSGGRMARQRQRRDLRLHPEAKFGLPGHVPVPYHRVMAKPMTKRQRLAAAIAGLPVDRLPVALWRHFFVEETSREGLVGAMVRWQRTYDWDFLKINPRAGYHVEDWGNRYEFSGNEHVPPTLVRARIHKPDDFRRLDRLTLGARKADAQTPGARVAPVLTEHLKAVADLRQALGPDVPMLMTVFTPMSIAADLAGGPQGLAAIIAEDPSLTHAGLRTITDTFADFAARCIEAGADGIFLATTHVATRANFTPEQYEEFGRPYDLEVLAAVQGATLNLLHVCKAQALVRELADYPAAMLNWDTAEPAARQARPSSAA